MRASFTLEKGDTVWVQVQGVSVAMILAGHVVAHGVDSATPVNIIGGPAPVPPPVSKRSKPSKRQMQLEVGEDT